MRLDPASRQAITEAIRDAFDSDGLAMLILATGRSLYDLTSDKLPYPTQVEHVVSAAERGNWIDQLIAEAKRQNATNRQVLRLGDSYPDVDTPIPLPSIPHHVIAPGRILTTIDWVEMVFVRDEGKPLWVDRSQVTNRSYARFVEDTGWRTPRSWGSWRVEGWDTSPVTRVSQLDIAEYCKWSKKRLPTQSEARRYQSFVATHDLTERLVGDRLLFGGNGIAFRCVTDA